MNYPEVVSKRLFEAIFPNARLVYRVDQANGEYDFDLLHADGTTAVMEVTSSVDQLQLETVAAIRSNKKGGSAIPTTQCRKSWMLFPAKGARINRLREKADGLLYRLEQDGIDSFSWFDQGSPVVPDICGKLAIMSGSVISADGPPSIRIAFPGGGGAVGAETATDAGEVEAWKQDNRKKLSVAGSNERHLVVYIDPMNGSPWTALTEFDPPARVANIPGEVTDIWLIGHAEKSEEFIVWHGRPDSAWNSMKIIFASSESFM